jgi:signal transduction histidine kinase
MKGHHAADVVRITVGAIFALCLTGYLYLRVSPFVDYAPILISHFFVGSAYGKLTLDIPPPVLGALLLTIIIFFVLYSIIVWLSAPWLKLRWLHRLDYYFVWLFALIALILIALCFLYFRYVLLAHFLLIFCGFILCMYLWATSLIRLRGGTLLDTIYWRKVFKTLLPNQFSGIFVIVTVSISSFLCLYNGVKLLSESFSFVFIVDSQFLNRLGFYFAGLCIPAFIVVIIAILCKDILRLALAREKEAEEKLKEERFRSDLITNVTHDIRTPLTSIINYVDLIRKSEVDNAQTRAWLETLDKKAQRLKILIGDLLDASRAGSGNLQIELSEIDLSELVGQIAGDFDEGMAAAHLEYINSSAGQKVPILADGTHLYRVLENLFSNAIKYAMPGTRIYIDISLRTFGETEIKALRHTADNRYAPHPHRVSAHSLAVLSIKNVSRRPLNISAEALMRQFVRGDQSRTTEGSGLGIYIADRLAALMGGRLEIRVNGDLFEARLFLPLASRLPDKQ